MLAVGGAIREGDSVDVLVSIEYSIYDEKGDESKPMQTTFYTIQDVPVLAISGQIDSANAQTGSSKTATQSSVAGPGMLTILVTPQDALLIKYAREKGTIDLVLRSPQFHDLVVTDPVYLDYIVRRFELPRPLIIRKEIASETTGADQ
jgi:Flp pilus assembly protein CpaB